MTPALPADAEQLYDAVPSTQDGTAATLTQVSVNLSGQEGRGHFGSQRDRIASARTLGNYALLLIKKRHDYIKAGEFFRCAVETDPQNVIHLQNYAVFLSDERRDYEQAELFYQRVLEMEPQNALALVNYAENLCLQSNLTQAKAILARLEGLPDLTVVHKSVCLFLRYANLWAETPHALIQLKALVQCGERQPARKFELSIERAAQDGHPNVDLLKTLADVINKKAPLETLDEFDEWRQA